VRCGVATAAVLIVRDMRRSIGVRGRPRNAVNAEAR
jgi:hypothetical protein